MKNINLDNKDASIVFIVSEILKIFDVEIFEYNQINNEYKFVDFWEADYYSIGLKSNQKLIYISTWENKHKNLNEMMFFVEFEIVDAVSSKTISSFKQFSSLNKLDLIYEIKLFLSFKIV